MQVLAFLDILDSDQRAVLVLLAALYFLSLTAENGARTTLCHVMRSQMADLGCATTPVAGQGSITAVPGTGGIATTIQSTLLLNNRASTRLPPRSLKPLRLSGSPGRCALLSVYEQ